MTDPTTNPTGTADALVLDQHVAAPVDTVFDHLVDPERVLRWLGTAIDIDPRPGGRFWMNANGSDTAAGTYAEIERPHRVVFSFGWEGSTEVPPGSTTVTITLEAQTDGTTMVRLRHDGLPGGAGDPHREGWTYFLGRLAEAGAGNDPGPVTH